MEIRPRRNGAKDPLRADKGWKIQKISGRLGAVLLQQANQSYGVVKTWRDMEHAQLFWQFATFSGSGRADRCAARAVLMKGFVQDPRSSEMVVVF